MNTEQLREQFEQETGWVGKRGFAKIFLKPDKTRALRAEYLEAYNEWLESKLTEQVPANDAEEFKTEHLEEVLHAAKEDMIDTLLAWRELNNIKYGSKRLIGEAVSQKVREEREAFRAMIKEATFKGKQVDPIKREYYDTGILDAVSRIELRLKEREKTT